VHIPYKSGNAGLADVLAGNVPLMMASVVSVLPHVRSGRLRAYGVTSAKRSASLPEVPTIAEAGVPGYEATQWYGILAPSRTSHEIVIRLHAELALIRGDEAKWAKLAAITKR
jgi:tripartite-type tricarboxylate transporter receptor subunit TctC